jgi:hypothetical protein
MHQVVNIKTQKKKWQWQYVFPAGSLSINPRSNIQRGMDIRTIQALSGMRVKLSKINIV